MRYGSDDDVLVYAPQGYLDEGLFGRLILWILEILPYLHRRGIYPQWRIPSALYGVGADKLAIPGVLDLAYAPPEHPSQGVSLVDLRDRHVRHLGPDWNYAHTLFNAYFRIPDRVVAAADAFDVDGATIGLHYRGTDKITSSWDSNHLTREDFLDLAAEFIQQHPGTKRVFLAADDPQIHDLLRDRLSIDIVHPGAGAHHQDQRGVTRDDFSVADDALRDCLLLSRCGAVMLTSSALSAFAKVLNPELDIVRCAASKLMWYGPYFPVAYIPVFEPADATNREILRRTMADDWTQVPAGKPFLKPFATKINWPWRYTTGKRRLRARVKRLLGRGPTMPHHYFG